MKKSISKVKGKERFLMGRNQYGQLLWLEAPSWDCGWYWGFGYLETSDSHTHVDTSLMKDVSNIFESKELVDKTFNEKEGWELTELFTQFYLLRKTPEFAGKTLPGCHVTTSPVNHGDLTEWSTKINKELIPRITKKIIEILTPKE